MDLLLNEEILVVFPLMPRWKCADQHQESNRISPPTFIQETKTCNYQTIFFILEHHSAVHCPVLMPTVDDVNERPIRRAVLSSGCHGYRLTDRRNQIHILHPITQSTPTIIRDKVEHSNRHVHTWCNSIETKKRPVKYKITINLICTWSHFFFCYCVD